MQRLLLVLLVAVSYLLFAGGLAWTLVPLLAIAAGGALLTPGRTFGLRQPWRSLDLALVALLAAIVIQIIPLPAAVVSWLSPHRDAIANVIRLARFGESRSAWSTLSVDPSATLVALGTVALGVLTFWMARATFSAGGSTRSVCRALTFIGMIAAVAAVLQKAVSPRSLLFLIEPDVGSASPFGAFVNRNHFGAWLLMVAAAVGGYLVARAKIHPLRVIQEDIEVRACFPGRIDRLMCYVYSSIDIRECTGLLTPDSSRQNYACEPCGLGKEGILHDQKERLFLQDLANSRQVGERYCRIGATDPEHLD